MSDTLKLDWCSHEAARYACEHWYSRPEMPMGKLAKIGVWENDKFIGALIFGCGTGGELSRIALVSHEASVSRIIRIALLMLRKAQPGLRVIVTYADPTAGHHGGVYQAGGWIYIGRSSKDFMYRDREGIEHHSRGVSASGFKNNRGKRCAVIKAGDCVRIPLTPKHKYIMPLDDETRVRAETLRKPYPKRAVEKE